MARDTGTAVPRYEELPDLVTPEEARAFLRVGRTHLYELVKTGALPSLTFGRTIRIPKRALLGDDTGVTRPLVAVATPTQRRGR